MGQQLTERLGDIQGHFLRMQDALIAQLRHLQAALPTPPSTLVPDVERLDAEIDAAEREVETASLRLLALQSPFAGDLKRALLIIQSTPDLERAGDYAKHLARALQHESGSGASLAPAIRTLSQMATSLRAATFPLDADAARQVLALDATVDTLHDQALRDLLRAGRDITDLDILVTATQAWRAAERLGDHLKNVATRLEHLSASLAR